MTTRAGTTRAQLAELCEQFDERCGELLRNVTSARERCDALLQNLHALDGRLWAVRAKARVHAPRAGCTVAALGDAATVRAEARSLGDDLSRQRAALLREFVEARQILR